jgi:hypothetical protein
VNLDEPAALRVPARSAPRRQILSDPPRTVHGVSETTKTPPVQPPRIPMSLARRRGGKLHVTQDGVKTACSALIPFNATKTAATLNWYLHTTCYNCAHRLWPDHGPADYICPSNGSDFPPQRRCPHGQRPAGCVHCTPRAAQNWPCPNGCTDPVDHDPLHRYTKCTVFPPRRSSGSGGRCVKSCESTEKAMCRVNPRLYFNLADSASMTCYHCGEPVCVSCQTTPAKGTPSICDRCADQAGGY